ncbi:MAG: hypothetical protein QNL91_11220, partial [Candidatus Krumholzibacteria bacterium]|nr:hypothetical protein [Candidatus Krumholzibacteria bacterium]
PGVVPWLEERPEVQSVPDRIRQIVMLKGDRRRLQAKWYHQTTEHAKPRRASPRPNHLKATDELVGSHLTIG